MASDIIRTRKEARMPKFNVTIRRVQTLVDEAKVEIEAPTAQEAMKLADILYEEDSDSIPFGKEHIEDCQNEYLVDGETQMSAPYDYKVLIDAPADDTPVDCDGCDWTGVFVDLEEIGDCSLTPGDPSPAGRCPGCGSLAYVVGK
jgi:hypothetical protein